MNAIMRLIATIALLLLAALRPAPYGDHGTMNQGIRFDAIDCGIEYRPAPVTFFCHVD